MRGRRPDDGAQLPATGELGRLVVRELHSMRVPSVAPDLGGETVLIGGTRLEPAFATKHSVHGSSLRP